MSKKLYFRLTEQDDEMEFCYPLSHHYDTMREEGLTEMVVCEAVVDKVDGFFFCNAVGLVSEKGECGKYCSDYEPRNGKSGNCKHNRNLYTAGKEQILKLKP